MQNVAQATQSRLLQGRRHAFGGQQALQGKGLLDRGHGFAGLRRNLGDLEQELAQQFVVRTLATFEQTPDAGIELRAEPARQRVGADVGMGQGIEKGGGDPPARTLFASLLAIGNGLYRCPHLPSSVIRFSGVLQPQQQALLVGETGGFQSSRTFCRRR